MAAQHPQNPHTAKMPSSERCIAISARRLAATLWELREISLFSTGFHGQVTKEVPDHCHSIPGTPSVRRNIILQLPFAPSPVSTHVTLRALRKSSVKCRFGDNMQRKPAIIGKLENARPTVDSHKEDDEDSTHEIEVDDGTSTAIPPFLDEKGIPGGDCGSTTSIELLKVLNRVCSLEEQHKSSISAVTALKSDLDGARSQVKDLTIKQRSYHREIENLTKKLADNKLEWQGGEEERTRQVLQAIKQELEDEKKSKRKLDLLHRKVRKELMDAKMDLMKASQELEREQKARELIEDVCDELAREVGEDKAKVEELKRESIKVREEVEEERKMLQVTEVWREERAQMKLAEARLEIEEKNLALDKLRRELEEFLKAKRASDASRATAIKSKTGQGLGSSRIISDTNESQSSTCDAGATAEARNEQKILRNSSIDVEIKHTILNHPGLNISDGEGEDCVQNDEDNGNDVVVDVDKNSDEDDYDDDLHSIEQDFYTRKYEPGTADWGQFKSFLQENVSYGKHFVDAIHSPVVITQGARQALASANMSKVERREMTREQEDKVKGWNVELLDSTLWQTESKIEREDILIETQFKVNPTLGYMVKSSEIGIGEPASLAQHEGKCNNLLEKEKICGESSGGTSSCGDSSPAPSSIITSSSLSPEPNTNVVWSNQNMGSSSRELKGAITGASPMQQCESPIVTRIMSTEPYESLTESPDRTVRSADRPKNASDSEQMKETLASGKPSKEKTVSKANLPEGKSERKQGRFRLCKGVVLKGL